MWRVDSLEKTLMLGGIGGRRRKGRQRMRWLDGITDSMDVNLMNFGSWWWTGRPGVLGFMESQSVRHDWASELNWTELRPLSVARRWPPSCCILIWAFLCVHRSLVSLFYFQISSSKNTSQIGLVPTVMVLFWLDRLLRALTPNILRY